MPRNILFGTGWRPDPPDERDYTLGHDHVRELLSGLGIHKVVDRLLPAKVDLRPWCSPVQFQGYYNTCTAHVIAGMVELLETKATGYYVRASRLFLYQVAKRILGESGDPGVYLRQMMGAVVLLGVPPEKFWPYLDTKIKDDPRLDDQPDAFCYSLARRYGTAKYFRLDPAGLEPERLVTRMKSVLAASIPTSLGFSLYKSSLEHAVKAGDVLFPAPGEDPIGSHAVLVVGYDDARQIPISGQPEGGKTTTGAFLFKNSWGEKWGASGYGWLPYRYLTEGLAQDCWTMMQAEWVETDSFQLDLETRGSAGPDGGDSGSADETGRRGWLGEVGEAADRIHSRLERRRRASSTRSGSSSPSSQ